MTDTAPPPALIPIDPKALEVAKAEAHKVWLTLDDYVEAAIRAYLAASGLPGVVGALKNVRHAIMEGNPEAIVDTIWVSDIETAVDHIDCALAAIKGGGDAG
jgi:hypothetical protein